MDAGGMYGEGEVREKWECGRGMREAATARRHVGPKRIHQPGLSSGTSSLVLGAASSVWPPARISDARPLLSCSVPQVYKYLSETLTRGEALSVYTGQLALLRHSRHSVAAGEAATRAKERVSSGVSRRGKGNKRRVGKGKKQCALLGIEKKKKLDRRYEKTGE